MSKPLDPVLLRTVSSARSAVIATALLVVGQTAAVVVGALLLARALGGLVFGSATWTEVAPDVGWFAVTFAARAALTTATEWRAHRGATRVIAELRVLTLRHVAALGPRWLGAHRAEVTTLVTRGLDDLEPYLVRYLPQLLQTAILTPAILVVMATQDLLAAATIALTIPLIPVFMWLIGVATQRTTEKRLAAQQRLNTRVLDLVAGLATLRSLGRARGTVGRVRELADAERRGTMGTLRIAFLSGAALELLATLSVAMVAVGVGLRLVEGDLNLVIGLAVLILAPEVLAPLRMVGTHFHASADGVAAVERCLTVLAEPTPTAGTLPMGDVDEAVWADVTVASPGRTRPAPEHFDARVRRGRVTVLQGPSGTGKTTAALALLGLLAPDHGTIRLRSGATWHDLADIDPDAWRRQVAWVPQHPVLEPGTLREVAGAVDVTDEQLDRAAQLAGFADVVSDLPLGWDTAVGGHAQGLSAGQRQRLALTRALLHPSRFLVLDEPTAHLDSANARQVAAVVREAAATGAGVLVLTHAAAVVDSADELVSMADTRQAALT
ncbi:thiol reductant ABC exporter subunit CydD [Pseudactinotalea sp.]|uniref:thiol reductant ABC exporter subunit CydD n=1 Tax=Pseudactinotalea sp. TaxID=1926260 RepID=UPI003B3B40F9